MTLDAHQRGALARMRDEAREELLGHILPFYPRYALDEVHGGFVGRIDVDGRRVPEAPKGIILNSRILWTFSRAHRLFGDPTHLVVATRAADALHDTFWDRRHGGVYSVVDVKGHPMVDVKRTYDQGFALYGFAEHFLATGDERSLERAIAIHRLLERRTFDKERGAYVDVLDARWRRGWKARARHQPAHFSMNSHLHLMEAHTVLLAAWDDPGLRRCQHRLIDVILRRFLDDGASRFRQDLDSSWQRTNDAVSYGHDLESCWLLIEALDQLRDYRDRRRVEQATLRVAATTLAEALDDDGGICYLGDSSGVVNRQKIWWTQAEAVVGLLDAFERSVDSRFLEGAARVWQFIRDELVDHELGEWRFAAGGAGASTFPDEYNLTIGPMKAPYHGGRACMEVIARAERMLAAS